MIKRDEVMPLLIGACPSYERRWADYVNDPIYEQDLLYVHLGDLACHLVELMSRGETAEFGAVFAVVERLHIEGDPYVSEAATIGLLEDIQSMAAHHGMNPEVFRPWLGPESARWWDKLRRFWGGDAFALCDTALG